MTPSITLHEGDCRVSLRRLIDQGVRVHSVVTDPPYGLVSVTKRFGKEGSAPAKHGTDGAFARASKGFMGKCFHPDTEIMTDRGWRRVTDVQIGDTVATLNPETRELAWQAVEQTHAYPFEGELVHVKHRSAEQMVTPNHRIVVSHDGGNSLELVEPMQTKRHFHLFAQAKPAAGIKGDPIIVSSQREYGRDRQIVRDTSTFDAPAFFRFFGLWLGDGYACTREDDHPANDFFGFTVKKERKIAAIRQALLDIKIKFTETPGRESETTAFYCYDFALLGFLKAIGKAADKHIPLWMFDRDASELEELYLGLMETDGCRQGKGQEIYYTTSRQLAEDFQRLCLQTGRSAISVFRPGGEPVNICGHETVSSDGWTLCVLQPGKRMYGERSNSGSNVIFEESFAGFVHCVGVPKHHILYTRFNGKPVWSGNSWDGTGIERDPEFWRLIYEILLPGGMVFAFSGARTGHWQACAMEVAGFIMHPMHGWLNGRGMPKAHNPKLPGWEGWRYGTQTQKPALEIVYLGQKPFSEKNGALNLLKHGVGAFNIDDCRVPAEGRPLREVADFRDGVEYAPNSLSGRVGGSLRSSKAVGTTDLGRWPANLLHDDSEAVRAIFPDSKGQQGKSSDATRSQKNTFGATSDSGKTYEPRGDTGSAARFFNSFPTTEEDYLWAIDAGLIDDPEMPPAIYHGKATKVDRAGSKHPTVKPIGLMEHFIRHITPPGGTVLDPFGGSGTTAEAARRLGMNAIIMEAEPDYIAFLRERFNLDSPPETVAPRSTVSQFSRATVGTDIMSFLA